MALSSPPTAIAPLETGRLAAGISATATTVTVSPIFKTVNGVRAKQGFNSTSGIAIISQGDYEERISFEGASVDATTKVTSLTSVTRGLSVTSTTASFSGGTGIIWPKGAKITLVADVSYFQSGVFTNVANTFSAAQTIANTLKWIFGASTNWIRGDGGDLKFKDANNSEVTLSTLAATGGSDEKVAISVNDTTPDYLLNKVTGGDGITVTETDDGGDETLDIDIDLATDSGLEFSSGELQVKIKGGGGVTRDGDGLSVTIPDSTDYVIVKDIEATTSATLTNPTTIQDFSTGQFTIAAGDIATGKGLEYDIWGTVTPVAGNVNIQIFVGSVAVVSHIITPASTSAQIWRAQGNIFGTEAAGASVTVKYRGTLTLAISGTDTHSNMETIASTTGSVVTNSSQTFKVGGAIGASNGSNVMTLTSSIVKHIVTTPE
jgi:hypothetical protein